MKNKDPFKREEEIFQELYDSFKVKGCYTSKFKIYNHKNRLSHCIFSVSKHSKGLEVAKQVFRNNSNDTNIVKKLEYHPSPLKTFNFDHSIISLKERILGGKERFNGLTAESLFKIDHIDTDYIFIDYSKALSELYEEGIINSPNKITSRGFGKKSIIKF